MPGCSRAKAAPTSLQTDRMGHLWDHRPSEVRRDRHPKALDYLDKQSLTAGTAWYRRRQLGNGRDSSGHPAEQESFGKSALLPHRGANGELSYLPGGPRP